MLVEDEGLASTRVAETEHPPTSVIHRFACLDGLRGVAAISVTIYHEALQFHSGLIGSAYLAVDFFFMLSGFVLCHAFQNRFSDGFGVIAYMKLRLIRLYPMYATGTFFLLLLAFLTSRFSLNDFIFSFLTITLIMPTPSAFSLVKETSFFGLTDDLFPLNPPAWSLFYELAANVVYALAAKSMSEKGLRNFLFLSLFALILMIFYRGTVEFGFELSDFPSGAIRVSFSFAAGLSLFLAFQKNAHGRAITWVPAIAPLTLLAALLLPDFGADARAWYDIVMITMAFPALIYVSAAIVPTRRANKLCAFLGDMSYPLYAIHVPLIHWIRWIANGSRLDTHAYWFQASTLVILVALSYPASRYFDRPVRAWLNRRMTAGARA